MAAADGAGQGAAVRVGVRCVYGAVGGVGGGGREAGEQREVRRAVGPVSRESEGCGGWAEERGGGRDGGGGDAVGLVREGDAGVCLNVWLDCAVGIVTLSILVYIMIYQNAVLPGYSTSQ